MDKPSRKLLNAIEVVNTMNRCGFPIVCPVQCAICGKWHAVDIAQESYSKRQGTPTICPDRECKLEHRRARRKARRRES